MLKDPFGCGFGAYARNARKIVSCVTCESEEFRDFFSRDTPFCFYFCWPKKRESLGLGLVDFASFCYEDHEVFVVRRHGAGGGVSGVDIASDNIVCLLLIHGDDGPTQSGGHLVKKRELFFESFGCFLAIGFVGGMRG